MRKTKTPSAVKWIIWTLAALFYFYEYLLRISPSVMLPELMRDFDTDAATIGVVVAFYLYAYAPFQLIVGVLMDYYGAKRLLTLASLVCGIGAIAFGASQYLWLASFGRLLIGAGSAFAFVGMVFICSHLFPKKKRALVIGLANSIGMLGAVAGGGPLSVVIHTVHWKYVMEVLGFIGLMLAMLIFVSYSEEKFSRKKLDVFYLFKLLKVVATSPYSWLNSVVASLFYLTTTTFGGLWGISFLQSAYGWSKQSAGFAMSMIFVGWLIGGPLIGVLSDIAKKRRRIISFSILITLLALLTVIYVPNLSPTVIYSLLLIIGLFSSAELLHFSYAIEINPAKTKGTAVAFTNGIVSLVESCVQPLIGWILVISWQGMEQNGSPIYSAYSYKLALLALPCALLLAFILSFFLKEKRYKEELTPHSVFLDEAMKE